MRRWLALALALGPCPQRLLASVPCPRVCGRHLHVTPRASIWMGGKGDGKQRRSKQADLPPVPPPPATAAQPVSRIQSSNSGDASHTVSVRKQIAYVKAYERAARRSAAKPAVRTSFRKKEKNNARAGMGDEEIIDIGDVNWRELPTLFIDGYNAVNAWPRLKKRFGKGQLVACREMLLEDVASFTIGRFNTTVVFDAGGAVDMNPAMRDRVDTYAGGLVRVVFAASSADEYIEKETRRLRAEGSPVWTATNDGGITTACSLHGATTVSANWLVAELKASRSSAAAVVADFNKRQDRAAGRRPTLWDVLDPALRETLDGRIEETRYDGLSRKQRETLESLRESGALDEKIPAAQRKLQLDAQRLRSKRRRATAPPPRRAPSAQEDDTPSREQSLRTTTHADAAGTYHEHGTHGGGGGAG
jgi:predicted RNA-binding protein with PIN domain